MDPTAFQFKMKMGTSRISGITHQCHNRPLLHHLSGLDADLTAVGIEGFDAVSVIQLKIIAVRLALSHVFHRSRRKGANGSAHIRTKINAVMKF